MSQSSAVREDATEGSNRAVALARGPGALGWRSWLRGENRSEARDGTDEGLTELTPCRGLDPEIQGFNYMVLRHRMRVAVMRQWPRQKCSAAYTVISPRVAVSMYPARGALASTFPFRTVSGMLPIFELRPLHCKVV